MKRSVNKPYQHISATQGHLKKSLLIPSVSVLLWQEPPDQTQWLWFILFSSPIVAIIILLVIAIFVLLIIIWLRNKRQQPIDIDTAPPVDVDIREELPVTEPTLPAAAPETIPSPAEYVEDLAKTQPSPVVRAAEEELQTVPVTGQRPPHIAWQIAGLTDVGLKRDLNEDTLLMAEAVMPDQTPYGLYVVADGLGGHHGGEIASQLTIDAIQNHFSQRPPAPTEAPFDDWLKSAAMAANAVVLARQEDREQAKKMGSTVVMALVMEGQAHIANVGDSRAYHLSSAGIQQVSVDHSLVERLVQIGQLTRTEARTHKNRNVLYNSIGEKPEMEVSLYHIDVQSGDRLLLCSDGLSGMITDEEILNISLGQSDPAQVCRVLIEAAKSAGGSDNITAIVIQMNAA